MDEQRQVASFIDSHDLEAPAAIRLLDLVSEVGELAKDAVESTAYGAEAAEPTVTEEELGDAVFALLAVAEQQDIDAGTALQTAIEKYEGRIEQTADPSSDRPA